MQNDMETYIAYFDETGDDGNKPSSSETFTLTSFCMRASDWQNNFNLMKQCRSELKEKYGFHISQEMHTKHFLSDKSPYREYHWDIETRRNILALFINYIAALNGQAVNVIIDKSNIRIPGYNILETALTYNIQRIENTSNGNWNYILVTDEGRISPMRKTARQIRAYNPIQSMFDYSYSNQPIKYMVEDIFEKNSADSYFIQVCDFISYFVHLYYKVIKCGKPIPNRVGRVIDSIFVQGVMDYFKERGTFNLLATHSNPYGLVIYPKK